MKLVTMKEFLAIEGNVIYAPMFGQPNTMDITTGDLAVRFEKINPTNWYSYPIAGDDVQTLSGANPDELDNIFHMVNGEKVEIPYSPSGTREYPSLFDENQRFLVLDDTDVGQMIHNLIEAFPAIAADVIEAIIKKHEGK